MNGIAAALLMVSSAPTQAPPIVFALQVIEQRIIIRIPVRRPVRRPRRGTTPNITWRESPADDCQPARAIAGARFTRPGVVDFLMRDRRLIRARLDSDCVNLGYYSSFYLVPGDDGRICVSRDLVQSRAGGQCAISGFQRLQAQPAN